MPLILWNPSKEQMRLPLIPFTVIPTQAKREKPHIAGILHNKLRRLQRLPNRTITLHTPLIPAQFQTIRHLLYLLLAPQAIYNLHGIRSLQGIPLAPQSIGNLPRRIGKICLFQGTGRRERHIAQKAETKKQPTHKNSPPV